ncbi:MAG: methyltransferase domain-containing protein [Acidimicrobiia bacterium]|nr:methyltransferase domain-containing protein [Acidimicrobiia bacterium]
MAEEFYTHGNDSVVVSAHAKRTAAEAAAFVLPQIEAGMRVLDLGCGPGSITVGLAEHVGPGGSVVGVDNSPERIELAQEAGAGVPALEFTVASVYELPFPDDSFDVAYSHQVMQHLADPVAALLEAKRVLRPGGLIAVRDADYGTMTHYPSHPELDEWLDAYHRVARANGGEPDAGRRLLEWVGEAGFTDSVATASVWSYATLQARREWANLWADRIKTPHFSERAGELGVADAESLASMAAGWRRWAEERDGWFGFIHGEVVANKPAGA